MMGVGAVSSFVSAADKSGDKLLSVEELKAYCTSKGIAFSDSSIESFFKEAPLPPLQSLFSSLSHQLASASGGLRWRQQDRLL